jgi:hypothetical protein
MTNEDKQTLKDFIDENEGQACRILFTDGQELELTLEGWWHDMGEEPHGHGTVLKVVVSRRVWKPGSAISFCLDEIGS